MTNKKELDLNELESVNGGVDLAPELYSKYKGGRVELYYGSDFSNHSHGGVIVDVAKGVGRMSGKIAFKIEFDSPSYNGWYWQEKTGPNYRYIDSFKIKGKTWDELQADDLTVL